MLQTTHMRQFFNILAIIVIQIVMVSTLSLLLSGLWDAGKANRLPAELSVAGIPLGGLTEREAAARLQTRVEQMMHSRLTLKLNQQTFFIEPQQINLRYNVQQTLLEAKRIAEQRSSLFHSLTSIFGKESPSDLTFSVQYDQGELRKQVELIGRQLNRPAASASAKVSGKSIVIVPEQPGIRVDVEKTMESVVAAWKHPLSLTVPVSVVQEQPKLTKKHLEGLDTFLAEAVTQVDPGVDKRMANVQRAATLLNGTIVLPDQVFSFNHTVAPYRRENGYEPVPVLEDEAIPDGLAGGAVQVASNLYVAAVKSHMTVLERYNNRNPVDFLPVGFDAFVREPDFDLRFVNRTKTAVYIHAELSGNQLRVAIFGGKSDRSEASMVTEQLEIYQPETIVRKDVSLEEGEEIIARFGRVGQRVKMFVEWTEKDGKTVRRQLSDDYYKPLHNIVLVGPKREDIPKKTPEEISPADEQTVADDMRPPDIPLLPESFGSPAEAEPFVPAATTDSLAVPAQATGKPSVRMENGIIIVEQ